MLLLPILRDGSPSEPGVKLPDAAQEALAGTAEWYAKAGYAPPWVGYLAVKDGASVGTCAFKTAPKDGRVEIAYYTFPRNEGKGVATEMAKQLVAMAKQSMSGIRVFAQTLPEENASTAVLKKLGFAFAGEAHDDEIGKAWEWELPARLTAASA